MVAILTFLALVAAGAAVMRLPALTGPPPLVVRAKIPREPGWYLAYSRGGVDEYVVFHDLGGAARRAIGADVLFLGNSRAMFALPQETLAPYFERLGLRYHVLAFPYNETDVFAEAIIRRYDLRPRLVVVNADPFFTGEPSAFARRVMAETVFDAWKFRFETETAFAVRRRLHRIVPYVALAPPNRDWVLFRSFGDGTTRVAAADGVPGRVPRSTARGGGASETQVARARRFQRLMASRGARLALLAIPPRSSGAAEDLAAALGVPFVDPAVRRLRTLDGSHLDPDSARAFSAAVLGELEPFLAKGVR